ncbi:Uncharacterised protein [Streptococcus pneumoniae]|nr:Uncharacterised protein [Streptococcus pneumoniae]VRJ57245.1 Uncharacterised protein [Streptococcus pneumoniae]
MKHQEVIDWLKYCDENNIKPWEWDFKNHSLSPLPNDSITAFLKYRQLPENEGIDCDKAAFFLYKCLGWQESQDSTIRGETMNSFITIFKEAIGNSSNFDEESTKLGITKKKIPISVLCEHQNYLKFETIQNNLENFKLFARTTHTIGNFTVFPNWMNCGRGLRLGDYWDITLISLQEFLNILSPEAWENFIKMYHLQPYVNSDYSVELFWDNHNNNAIRPTKEENFQIFLKKVNERIEERGKFIIKLICDQLDQKDFNFYKEIENMDKIKFSNEF